MTERVRQSGAAGSKTFSGSDSRRYNYFEPQGRRATLYEDVTVDVQPDVSRYLIQGWTLSFADGTPTYHEGTTVMKCADWHVFRAPDQEWERTHYQRQSRIESTIKTVVDNARGSGAPARFDPGWVTLLQNHVGALKHVEFGLGVALTKAQRDGITQMVNNTILTNSSYKLRLAQDITLYLGDLGLDIDIDGDAGKECWMEHDAWQGVRKAVEAILAATDHIEVYFVINAVFEALVGDLIRSGLVTRAGPAHNDYVTPAVLAPALEDYQRNLANTMSLLLLLVNDTQYGEANKQHIAAWLKTYVPLCVDAANQSRELWDMQATNAVTFETAYGEAKQRLQGILAELDVSLPQGVSL
jgi:propane 2-monooxygenase small subunit